ncbi:von Willebrand factor type A domain protein [Gemmata obscuriglobus]|uniref:vWA domain-containing protein n=1 Tax=Gemmata obscuriglobus TaxID=114 RepID=UPI00016C34E4|nr:vWA domain-containing protein [Gemmata obscuriglobus]QEG29031.1 von Willebrand factor type A domain protein [Gemmata obscuriglobus]VTS07637.1 von Willebrand factor type A OS=Isosphaera pallida (strain ATCC 43644 / DSM 9630 / IS1B) GN=Isop_3570 PE=4 SV=1: VWA_2 [Gemmata obscuriglobus UQM 2246]
MTFEYPYALFLLAVPVLLLAWVWLREGRRVALPVDHGPPGRGTGWWVAVSCAESLLPLALAVAVLLCAGPRRLGEPIDKRKLTNIEICVDVSGSMNNPFGRATRYDGAMEAVTAFTSYRQGDAFGLTFFGNEVLHWCPLTTDVSAINCATPFMRPGQLPPWFGGTLIAKALRACKAELIKRPEGDRMIVLITDGDSQDFANGADAEVAEELKAEGITVFAVVIGNDRQFQNPIIRNGSVQTVTARTGGESFEAGDPNALATVFKRIDEMRRAETDKQIASTLDDFRPFCIAGLVLTGLAGFASFGLRYTPW